MMDGDQPQRSDSDEDLKRQLLDSVITHMNIRQTEIGQLAKQSNDQEFTVCRFLMGWAVAAIALIVGHFLVLLSNSRALTEFSYSLPLKSSLPLWGLSLAFGIMHHFSFIHQQRSVARQFDRDNREFASQLHQRGYSVVSELVQRIRNEHKAGSVLAGVDWFLYIQAGLFITAAIVVAFAFFS